MAYYPGATTGGGAPGSEFYPMSLMDYTPPEAMEGIPLEYQPWLQPENMPDSLWNYQAPTLDEWSTTPRNWDWALGGRSTTSDDDDDTDDDKVKVDDDVPITDVDNIEKIKRVKSDFVKGKEEATAESVLNTLYGVDSGIWATPERRRVNTPWVNPASVIADQAKPRSEWKNVKTIAGWKNPDYVAPASARIAQLESRGAPNRAAVTPTRAPVVDFAAQQQRLIDESRARYNRNAPAARAGIDSFGSRGVPSRTNLRW
jgi:hypothetical protein